MDKFSKKNNLKIQINGIASLISFKIISHKFDLYKKIISEEMLKNKILASNKIYLSISHKNKFIKKYLSILEKIFFKIGKIENQ